MNIIELDSYESLDTEKERRPSILNCIRDNNIEAFKSLIKEKGIHKRNDGLDWTYLHYAVFYNNIEIAKELLNAGTDINSPSVYNETPLFIAVREKNVEMVDFLIKNNANLYYKDKYNMTPLDTAKLEYKFNKDEELGPKLAEIINKLETKMTDIINKLEVAINIDKKIEKSLININEPSR